MTNARRAWPWSDWSLARRLPLLTAAIVVLVVASTLTITYSALRRDRTNALHQRLTELAKQLAASSEQTSRARAQVLREVAADSVVQRAVLAGEAPAGDSSLLRKLEKLAIPTDSGLPVELWSADGQRIAFIGKDVRANESPSLSAELHSLRPGGPSELPTAGTGTDSVQFGSLYQQFGRVYFWAVAPVLRDGKRIGYITQQRRVSNTPQAIKIVRALVNEDVDISIRNTTDDFWTNMLGDPVRAPARDTMDGGFISRRQGSEPMMGSETRISNYPWMLVLEIPTRSVLTGPRDTLRRIALLSLLLIAAGVLAAWALSRQVTRPLVELTTAAEAIAQGEHGRRVITQPGSEDEVSRLGESFNRMAAEVESSQRELASQVDAALHANRAKSDFLAVMSHELRTPLNAIGGYTEILEMGLYGEVNAQQRDALARISRSQQALLSLINDVLNFAKLEAGEVQYSMADVSLEPVFEALETMIAPQLRDRKLTYHANLCDHALRVHADKDKLQQILLNLLSNAVKFTPEGGSIELACAATAEESTVAISVRDTGIGIAADRIGPIFDPFIQVGRALNRPHDGVGLGLSISRDLATAMGGSLAATSEVGAGSTFTLTLQRSTPG